MLVVHAINSKDAGSIITALPVLGGGGAGPRKLSVAIPSLGRVDALGVNGALRPVTLTYGTTRIYANPMFYRGGRG